MTFKAIAFDLDGTLLDSQKNIRPSTVHAVGKARARGIDVILVTGRHHISTHAYHHQLGLETPAICCNGAYFYNFQSKLPEAPNAMGPDQYDDLLKMVRKYGFISKVYTTDAMTYERPDHHIHALSAWSQTLPTHLQPNIRQVDSFETLLAGSPPVWKFIINHPSQQELLVFAEEARKELNLSCEFSWFDTLDVTREGNSKGGKLTEWAALKGIDMANVIAFGDNHNDTSMLQAAGMGVAMQHGEEAVKAIADAVTDGDNNSDALAEAIYRYVL